uniref:sarcosine oxidasee (formaldehyde-forming) n=1 Tax=Araucaria cunninghamii TaxID=56994 RepID=A0A0D6QWI5_ARACU
MGEIEGEYEVIVVGAGIMGSCTAYQIAKRGKSVLLLEQYDFLHRRGSSHGESRTIRETYPEEYYTAMMEEAYALWEEAQNEIGYRVHVKTKQLDMGSVDNKSLQSVIGVCRKLGVPHEVLTPEQTSSRFEAINIPKDWIAVVTNRGGILRASKAVAMFQSLALKNGAVLRDNAQVIKISTEWKLKDGSIGVLVCTRSGSVLGSKCVITAGAWAHKLAKEISDIELPIQPIHTNIAYWKIEKGVESFSPEKGFPTFASYNDPYLYGTPSLEYPGLLKVSIHGGYPCDPDKRILVPDMDAVKQKVSPWLAGCFRHIMSESPVLAEACMYSMSPDEDYILDFLPLAKTSMSTDKSPILIATGFSGHGFKMGPLVGRIMADLALKGEADRVPLKYFTIERFLQSPRGNPKDYGDQVCPYQRTTS